MHFPRQQGRNLVSFAIFAMIVKVLDQKQFLIKQSLHDSNFVIFNFLENGVFF